MLHPNSRITFSDIHSKTQCGRIVGYATIIRDDYVATAYVVEQNNHQGFVIVFPEVIIDAN